MNIGRIEEITTRAALSRAAGKKIAIWGYDEHVLAALFKAKILDGIDFCLISDWEGHFHFNFLGRKYQNPPALLEFQPDEILIISPTNVLRVYEDLIKKFRFSPKEIFIPRENWKERLYQPDPQFFDIQASIPKSIAGGLSCAEVTVHLFDLIKYITHNNIPGDIVNLGVFQGWSMYFIAECLRCFQSDRIVIGFDTFDGFVDSGDPKDFFCDYQLSLGKTGKNFFRNTGIELVRGNLSAFENIELISGDIAETIGLLKQRTIALALFDMDDYTPTAHALGPVYKCMSAGAVMLFDHYSYHTLAEGSAIGQRLAMDEFLSCTPMLNLTGTNAFVRI